MENHHARKRSRSSNGSGEEKAAMTESSIAAAAELGFRQWQHPSSRIFRVSRASGGKDRHSKVFTSKGLRDRRVRLSVSTAIQFYDLQDRLGYDQPSKAIEWLIKAASTAIAELPSLPSSFPELPEPIDGEQNVQETAEAEPDHNLQKQKQHAASLSMSGCSSTSASSKGSVLSLFRSAIRVKARERARERAAKDKEKDREEGGDHLAATDHSQSSFTELLTAAASAAGGGSNNAVSVTAIPLSATTKIQHASPSTVTADYFVQAGEFALTSAAQKMQAQQLPSSFCSPQAQNFSSCPAVGIVPYNIGAAAAAAATTAGDHPEMQQFSFINDHSHIDYNLNFSIAAGLAGFRRGTLQSNTPANFTPNHNLLPFSSPSSSSVSMEGPNLPFLFSAAASASSETHFHSGLGSHLQLTREPQTPFFLDGYRPPDLRGKGKS